MRDDPTESDESAEPATPEPRRARVTFTVLLVAVAAAHLLAVTLAALPPNQLSASARPATSYLGSYFAQNWRLFAPNPIDADRSVRFQAAYQVDGEVETTGWIDWTSIELGVVRQHLVGGRAGYVTNKAYGVLGSRYRGLDDVQRETADVVDPADAPAWSTFRTDLRADSQDAVDDQQVESYLAYDRAFTALATQVFDGRASDDDGGRELVAVRYATRSIGVTPWEARTGTAEDREAARPTPQQRINGWRQPLRGDDAESASIADFDERHR